MQGPPPPPADPNAPPPPPADPNAPAPPPADPKRRAAAVDPNAPPRSATGAGAGRQRRGRLQLCGARGLEGRRRDTVVLRAGLAEQDSCGRPPNRTADPRSPPANQRAARQAGPEAVRGRGDRQHEGGHNGSRRTWASSSCRSRVRGSTRRPSRSMRVECRARVVLRGEVHRHEQAQRPDLGRRRRSAHASRHAARPARARALVRGLAWHREQSGHKGEAVTLAQSIRPWTPPPPPPPDPNAPPPPPPAGGTNAPGQNPNVGVPVPVDPNSVPPGMLPPS